MLDRNRIISSALLKLNEVSVYNDNRSDIYKIADKLLDNVLDFTAAKSDFLFNSFTAKLLQNVNKKNELGENRFNLPNNFLSKIRFVNSNARMEGEYVYSNDNEVYLQYCRSINLSDFPLYLFNYIVYTLALELAESNNAYSDKIQLLNIRLEEEKILIYHNQQNFVSREV